MERLATLPTLPATLTVAVGDATSPQLAGPVIVAHVVNDIGAWGRGFVVALADRWPHTETTYRRWHRDRLAPASGTPFELGRTVVVPVASPAGPPPAGPPWWVAHLLAQRGVRGKDNPVPLDLPALRRALDELATLASARSAAVAMPRIGCGLAGGRWEQVEPLVTATLVDRGVPVVVHDLPGDAASR